MNIVAIWDYCLIKELDYKERTSASGIILAEKKKNETWKGEVLALWTTEQEHVSVWDVIYFNRYLPQEVTIEDERCLMLAYKDIQAKEIALDN